MWVKWHTCQGHLIDSLHWKQDFIFERNFEASAGFMYLFKLEDLVQNSSIPGCQKKSTKWQINEHNVWSLNIIVKGASRLETYTGDLFILLHLDDRWLTHPVLSRVKVREILCKIKKRRVKWGKEHRERSKVI